VKTEAEPVLPWVKNERMAFPPKGNCHSNEPEAGRCLVALVNKGTYGKRAVTPNSIVIVRNVHRRGKNSLVVENTVEYRKFPSRGTATALKFLRPQWDLYRGPWSTVEPVMDFRWETTKRQFDRAWEKRQWREEKLPSGHDAHKAESREMTPTLRLFELHWQQQNLPWRWTGERYLRLCALWKLTKYELAALIQWPAAAMEQFLKVNPKRVTLPAPGPVLVWLHFLESIRLGVEAFPSD
jgi:hypothetical protein